MVKCNSSCKIFKWLYWWLAGLVSPSNWQWRFMDWAINLQCMSWCRLVALFAYKDNKIILLYYRKGPINLIKCHTSFAAISFETTWMMVASPMSLWLLWWPPTGSSMFMVVVMLLMYSVLYCLYSVGNKITTIITTDEIYDITVYDLELHNAALLPHSGSWLLLCPHVLRLLLLLSWWRHQMETFSALLAICAGNSPVSGEFPAERPVTRSFDVFFICVWINSWVNNRETGNLRRHRTHYDVTAMVYFCFAGSNNDWFELKCFPSF